MPTILESLQAPWQRAVHAATHRPFAGRATSSPRDLLGLDGRSRILVIGLERIGDVLVGIPVLRSLRARYPGARLELLVSQGNSAVADAVGPFVDQVWVYEKTIRSALALLRALHRSRYDVIVDLVDHPSTTAQLVIQWCRPRAAVGLLHTGSGVYTHAAPALDPAVVHPVERLAQLLLPFGIDPAVEPLDLEYPLTTSDAWRARSSLGPTLRPYRLGVNVSCRQPGRDWGEANYVALVGEIAARHPEFEVYVCGSPQNASAIARIGLAAGVQAAPPRASLSEFAAILHEFDLLVTPDTVAVHIAAAWKLPAVVLSHAVPGVAPRVPYHTSHRALMGRPAIPSISVAEVAAAVDGLIQECFGAGLARGSHL